MIALLAACGGGDIGVTVVRENPDSGIPLPTDTGDPIDTGIPCEGAGCIGFEIAVTAPDGTDCTDQACGATEPGYVRLALWVEGPGEITTTTPCYGRQWRVQDHTTNEVIVLFDCQEEETAWSLPAEATEVHALNFVWEQSDLDDGIVYAGEFLLCVDVDGFTQCQVFSL